MVRVVANCYRDRGGCSPDAAVQRDTVCQLDIRFDPARSDVAIFGAKSRAAFSLCDGRPRRRADHHATSHRAQVPRFPHRSAATVQRSGRIAANRFGVELGRQQGLKSSPDRTPMYTGCRERPDHPSLCIAAKSRRYDFRVVAIRRNMIVAHKAMVIATATPSFWSSWKT